MSLEAASLFICQPGYESLLNDELAALGLPTLERSRGCVHTGAGHATETCFAHLQLVGVSGIDAPSVNAQAEGLLAYFMEQIRGVVLTEKWPLIFRFADGNTGLGQRTKAVEKEFLKRLKKRMPKPGRTATGELPRGGGRASGLCVYFAAYDRLFAATEMWAGGQRRMADDPEAPSRSYLKTEEAFTVMEREPLPGETAVDLGAAPGGWSYSAARRGAHVIAIDNGPMKGGAKDHPLIEHRKTDAFRFLPAAGETFDWLLCDLVEEPHQVLRLIELWLQGNHCRHFVVNLKFGRADALQLLRQVTAPNGYLSAHCNTLRVRHLFHDRDEFTLMGSVGKSNP